MAECKYLYACLYCDIWGTFCQSKGTDETCDFFDNGDGPLYGME